MTFIEIRDQIAADINSTRMNYANCSEAVWAVKDLDEECKSMKEYFEAIINACATGKVFDLTANQYVEN